MESIVMRGGGTYNVSILCNSLYYGTITLDKVIIKAFCDGLGLAVYLLRLTNSPSVTLFLSGWYSSARCR